MCLKVSAIEFHGVDRRERTSTDNGDAFLLVRTEVPRRVHCCEPSVRDADWPNGARETRSSRLCSCIRLRLTVPRAYAQKRKRKRKKEEKESVGGSVANHFLPGRVRSSNNRILVRAASEKGCTPLYVRSERTATKKKRRGGGEKKEARGKEGEGGKKKKKKRNQSVARCSNNTSLYSFHIEPPVGFTHEIMRGVETR